ncbi:MAG: patatin-like phospholipase family protein [Alphaproteobacteria bacterium]|nr:patatin-like phospholipase family protein [Alphaproteobacteria bacterium]
MTQTQIAEPQAGQIVLVLQGGGALGAYQAGVYEGLHRAGIEPDWVIGTSIGAINGALIACNPPERRLEKLTRFWNGVSLGGAADVAGASAPLIAELAGGWAKTAALLGGVPGFYDINLFAAWGVAAPVGAERAAFYSTAPLKSTLGALLELDYVNARHTRLTVGAVDVESGQLKYFDSRRMTIGIKHIMASGALPPGFPAIAIEGRPYWDGGIYSNTPVEAVLDDEPRRDSLIFAVNLWRAKGATPESIWQVLGRQKEIQYASRVRSHIARQEQIHRLRHVVRELASLVPADRRNDPRTKELAAYGCTTTMHLVELLAPRLPGDDQNKDIDFSASGIAAHRQAGLADIRRVLDAKPWRQQAEPLQGVVIHEMDMARA